MHFFAHLAFHILRLASKLTRPISRRLLAWLWPVSHCLIPKKRLFETRTLFAIHHPRPSYSVHLLILPKQAIASLCELEPAENVEFLQDLVQAVRVLVRDFQLEDTGYRLIANSGKYQDIPMLHFHLVSDFDSDQ
jgi:histidine triad (HIT) family protein